jgi:hypothetical protein
MLGLSDAANTTGIPTGAFVAFLGAMRSSITVL